MKLQQESHPGALSLFFGKCICTELVQALRYLFLVYSTFQVTIQQIGDFVCW